nr:hypothetical protein [Chromobacterium violaceum]
MATPIWALAAAIARSAEAMSGGAAADRWGAARQSRQGGGQRAGCQPERGRRRAAECGQQILIGAALVEQQFALGAAGGDGRGLLRFVAGGGEAGSVADAGQLQHPLLRVEDVVQQPDFFVLLAQLQIGAGQLGGQQ